MMMMAQGQRPCGPGTRQRGFSMLELVVTLLIMLIVVAIAVPLMRPAVQRYQLRAAATSVGGAIQATRYRAISDGFPYQLVLSKAAGTYQVQNNPNFLTGGGYANVGSAVPISGFSTVVTLSGDTTFQFRPSGLVTAPVGAMNLTLTYAGNTETITVSTYGNVKVTP